MIQEVRSDYYCDDEGCTYIDVWDDSVVDEWGEPDGFSVAKVFSNPLRVVCQPNKEKFFAEPIVQEEILNVVKEELGVGVKFQNGSGPMNQ